MPTKFKIIGAAVAVVLVGAAVWFGVSIQRSTSTVTLRSHAAERIDAKRKAKPSDERNPIGTPSVAVSTPAPGSRVQSAPNAKSTNGAAAAITATRLSPLNDRTLEPATAQASGAPDDHGAGAMQGGRISWGGGTPGMIAAHASLRLPEVANPDSKTNRQILETMLTKAITRAAGGKITRHE